MYYALKTLLKEKTELLLETDKNKTDEILSQIISIDQAVQCIKEHPDYIEMEAKKRSCKDNKYYVFCEIWKARGGCMGCSKDLLEMKLV